MPLSRPTPTSIEARIANPSCVTYITEMEKGNSNINRVNRSYLLDAYQKLNKMLDRREVSDVGLLNNQQASLIAWKIIMCLQ